MALVYAASAVYLPDLESVDVDVVADVLKRLAEPVLVQPYLVLVQPLVA